MAILLNFFFRADHHATPLHTDLNLVGGKRSMCTGMENNRIAGKAEVVGARIEKFGFSSVPIFGFVAGDTASILEEFIGVPGNQIVYLLLPVFQDISGTSFTRVRILNSFVLGGSLINLFLLYYTAAGEFCRKKAAQIRWSRAMSLRRPAGRAERRSGRRSRTTKHHEILVPVLAMIFDLTVAD
jgi:hypothetical protein